MKKLIILIIIASIISAGITFALMNKTSKLDIASSHSSDEASHDEEADTTIDGLKTSIAITGKGWDSVEANGKVIVPPSRLVNISSRIEGKIVAAYANIGDSVSKGEVLAVVSSIELAEARNLYKQASARTAAADNNYKREIQLAKLGSISVRSLEEARSDNLVSQGNLAEAKGNLSQAKSELAQSETEYIQCKARLERASELFVGKVISKQDLETAETEYKRDLTKVEAAKSLVLQAEANIDKMKAKLDISNQYLAREEKIYKSKVLDMRSIQSAKAELTIAKIELQSSIDRIKILGAKVNSTGENINIISPISGKVTSRTTNIGEMVSPSDTLFIVANQSQVWVEADIYEKDISKIKKGQSVEIKVDSYPDKTFSGKVDSISDVLGSESRTLKIRCNVSNIDGLLKAEMFAKLSVITGLRGTIVLIPKLAVLDEAGKKIVFTACMDCKEDIKANRSVCGNYDKVEIEIGSSRKELVEVLSGLKPGMEVVTAGAFQLKTAISSGKLSAGCADED